VLWSFSCAGLCPVLGLAVLHSLLRNVHLHSAHPTILLGSLFSCPYRLKSLLLMNVFWKYICSFVPFFFLFLLMLRNEIEDSLFPSALQQFLVYSTTYCIYSPVTLISSFILCRSWLLVLALLSLFCGWTAYVLECSTKTWMLYCV